METYSDDGATIAPDNLNHEQFNLSCAGFSGQMVDHNLASRWQNCICDPRMFIDIEPAPLLVGR